MPEPSEPRPERLEIVADHTASSSCDEGFLRLRRLEVRHHWSDGRVSQPYPCDIVSRPGTDAVGVVLFQTREGGETKVVLKEGIRPPVWLRREQDLIQEEPEAPLMMVELVAGILEPEDRGHEGLMRRAQVEAREEAGVELPMEAFFELGSALFPSPGVADEKVFLFAAEVSELPADGGMPVGDGSTMEDGTCVRLFDLPDAIAACRRGDIPNMLAEIGLTRLQSFLEAQR
ncbi:MAG: NUDIX hydrolase [Planctomycetes bacterium]|nr:NUDIX hydrolase [Planctomycetota bacterium]